jgi:hypothetical protein
MTPLISNFYSLGFLATHIQLSVYTLQQTYENDKFLNKIEYSDNFLNQTTFSNSLKGIIANYSIIQFCSFLDEYKNFNSKYIGQKYFERIKKVRRKNHYGIQRINQWSDLYNFRNQMVAHNFDIKNESVFLKKELINYKIPDTLDEKILFYKIILKICQNISSEFQELNDEIDLNFTITKKIKILKNLDLDLDKEIDLIEKNM